MVLVKVNNNTVLTPEAVIAVVEDQTEITLLLRPFAVHEQHAAFLDHVCCTVLCESYVVVASGGRGGRMAALTGHHLALEQQSACVPQQQVWQQSEAARRSSSEQLGAQSHLTGTNSCWLLLVVAVGFMGACGGA